ncbi:Pet127-domain-containing protein [Leucogyrophana mollusca]|uniref:Pet127-domain-containing protein n=1 Tax=Leucogyrophana mollusca TaxID=85980 RepID=A0ACB8BGK3_9AGAM|nr:Pet127-domain-containing protein [Leucogyrophana mollusca]
MKKALQHVRPRISLSRGTLAHFTPQPFSDSIRRYTSSQPEAIKSQDVPSSDTFSEKLRILRKSTNPSSPKSKGKSKGKSSPSGANINGVISDSLARKQENQSSVINALVATPKAGKKGKKGKRKAVASEEVHEQVENPTEVFGGVSRGAGPRATNGFITEEWRDDWGQDTLKPPDTPPRTSRRGPPPHGLLHPLPYTRRIEGFLADEQEVALTDLVSPSAQKPIATLAHGLERVLFNPGVHWLQDPRSRVYNFTPWVESVPKVTDFAFERVTGFIKSSADEDLQTLAKQEGRTFAGSTSSLTGMLSHVYFLVSGDRDVDTSLLSRHFQHEPTNFTPGQRMPTSVVLNYKDGVYTIDSDKSDEADKNLLTWMGTMLEKFLTVPESEFTQYLRPSAPEAEDDGDTRREAYRYAKSKSFVMRSQLDCVDNRLPGTGVFDIKTRAAVPIRLDMLNYEENSGYLIRTLHGPMESFEKEYYDLIRSAFLKYSFQARIGNMDGVFVAYHNTARIFGFQYVSLEEMDARLFGGAGRGERVFAKCVRMLERVMDEVVLAFPEKSVRCTFETKEHSDMMRVWIEPAEWDEDVTRPIAQLDVEVESFLDNKPVRGPRAVAAAESPWLLHWKVSHSSLDPHDIRTNLAEAQERQFRAWAIPSDVEGIEEMEKKWNALDFGGKRRGAEVDPHDEGQGDENQESTAQDSAGLSNSQEELCRSTFDPAKFKAPSGNIRYLRRLAREGRDETERGEAERKVVWTEPGLESVDVQADSKSFSDADGGLDGEVETGSRCESEGVQSLSVDTLSSKSFEADVPVPVEGQAAIPADQQEGGDVANANISVSSGHQAATLLTPSLEESAVATATDTLNHPSRTSETPQVLDGGGKESASGESGLDVASASRQSQGQPSRDLI